MISRILCDLGHGNLQDRIDALHKVIESDNVLVKAQTEEEAFIQLALKDKNMHKKAKLLISQLLNQI